MTEVAESTDASVVRSNKARIHDYWLGGSDHGVIDRVTVELVQPLVPQIVTTAGNRTSRSQGTHLRSARCCRAGLDRPVAVAGRGCDGTAPPLDRGHRRRSDRYPFPVGRGLVTGGPSLALSCRISKEFHA
ncbi:SAM-dependent methyltransferase [Streptomyces sp. 110]|uniref:SAM-dependent methyltransferase n=1 Tax=Streptomyces endocoffeicus TaxID=2898945 RepID=A0ABS1PS86_9ACTN|nr:SAM-dependent methyltransferase [Streptomyces endocoffeicus]